MRSESIAVVSNNLRQIIDAGAVRAERLAVGCNGNILRAINLHDTGYRGSLITEASFMRSYSSPVPSYHTLQRAYRVALRRDSVRVRDQRFVITRQLRAMHLQLRAVQVKLLRVQVEFLRVGYQRNAVLYNLLRRVINLLAERLIQMCLTNLAAYFIEYV